MIYVDGQFLAPVFNNGILVTNPWIDTVVLQKGDYNHEPLQWSSQLVRKIILYPLTTQIDGIGYATILHKVNLHWGHYGFEIVTVWNGLVELCVLCWRADQSLSVVLGGKSFFVKTQLDILQAL